MTRRRALDPVLTAGGRVLGRPRKLPPPDAAERIAKLASEAYNLAGIADCLGVCPLTLKSWRDADPTLQEAFETGRERLHQKLKSKLLEKALDGEVVPLLFALKTMFAYREGEAVEGAKGGVHVVINLPGAKQPTAYIEEVKNGS